MRVHHFAAESLFPLLAGPLCAYDSRRIRWIPMCVTPSIPCETA